MDDATVLHLYESEGPAGEVTLNYTYSRDNGIHAYFAGHGYASIRVDLRGSGEKTEATIRFAGVGSKTFVLAWTPIQKL